MEIRNLLSGLLTGGERLAILGCGSVLMADDGAGMAVTDALIERFGPEPERFRVFSGSTAPECFTGVIKAFAPDHVVIVDAADMGLEPGALRVINPDDVAGVSFSTHMLPLKVTVDYLKKETGCRVTILGIQPRSLEFGADMTDAVRVVSDGLTAAFGDLLSRW